MLMKLTTGVNFTNILLEPFLYERVFQTLPPLTVWLCNFFGAKAARKMLVRLTTGQN